MDIRDRFAALTIFHGGCVLRCLAINTMQIKRRQWEREGRLGEGNTYINIIVLSQRRHPSSAQSSFTFTSSSPWIYPAGFVDHIRGSRERKKKEGMNVIQVIQFLSISASPPLSAADATRVRATPPLARSALDPIMVPMKIISPSLNDFLLLIACPFPDKDAA